MSAESIARLISDAVSVLASLTAAAVLLLLGIGAVGTGSTAALAAVILLAMVLAFGCWSAWHLRQRDDI